MITLPARYVNTGDSANGGFGEVLFCTDTHLERKVAIKFIPDISEKARLNDELKALLQLRSKHVVQVYDLIIYDSSTYGIVEEFIDGEDLWLSNYPRKSLSNYLKTLWQISSGISDIHSAGIIHRDIKPNNMHLNSEGLIKIYDFGLARETEIDAKTTGFKGTQGFAAPELFASGTVDFTSAVDTYAFGISAIFLSDGTIPSCLQEMPPRQPTEQIFSKLKIELPENLAILLERCISTNPADRPTMPEVRDEVARYLLQNRHQAIMILNNQVSSLDVNTTSVTLGLPTIGKIEIKYDGLHFRVTDVGGEVFINNTAVTVGHELPSSCVVALGAGYRRSTERAFVIFDLSNPEVVL